MLPSTATVQNLNTPYRSGFFFPNDRIVDQFLRKITFEPVLMSTEKFSFGQASSIPNSTFFSRDGTLTNSATNIALPDSGEFKRIGAEVEIDLFNQIGSRGTDQLEQQVYAVKLRILRELSTKLLKNATASSIIGLDQQLLNGNGLILTASNPFTLQDLYKGVLSCKPTDNLVGAGADCILSHNSILRQVLYLLDQAQEEIEWRYDEDLDCEIPIICGVPWYLSELAPSNRFYILKIQGKTSIRLLYAKDPLHECDKFGIHVYTEPLKKEKNNLACTVIGYYQVFVPENTILVGMNSVMTPNIT